MFNGSSEGGSPGEEQTLFGTSVTNYSKSSWRKKKISDGRRK
jgi:hypothetical protein